ncbi:MAG: ABC transporter substrate-binding protein [Candidatus Limiplasma sp.]|nr:ABC transporter substrate-binding protein [Clostridiales bacterium]MDY3816764.1 ABC transporter substrate-binding protein [Candidatus Limiplasma sp.]
MKKYFALLLAVLMMIPAFSTAENVVKIGVFEPASGDSGAGGKQEILGMQYANSVQPTVDIGGETYQVELVYADNGSSTDKAPSAAQQLVSAGVSVVLGSYGSGVSIAGSQYFADAGIPAIGVTCTNPQVTAGNSHYFRICFLDPFQGTVLANYAFKELGAKTAYCLAELGNDYDVGLCYYFQKAFEEMGGTVISDTFPTGNSDFTSYLSNATAIGADVFFCPVSIAYSSQIISQAAGQNVTYPILGSDTLDNNKVAEAAKGTNVKVIITTFYQEGGSPEFDEGFKAWLNSDSEYLTNNGGNDMISAVSVMGYDAYFTALESLKAAGSTDSKAVMAAMPGVKYTGVTGEIAFDETGDAIRDSAYIKSVNTETGAWDFVAVQTVD